MREYFPLIFVGAAVGIISIVLLIAYFMIKDKKSAIGFERNMKDSEIIKRLLVYARPYKWDFILVFLIMLISVAYDISSPLIIGSRFSLTAS